MVQQRVCARQLLATCVSAVGRRPDDHHARQQHGFTALLVTHDVSEAVALADRVLLIEDGGLALDERIALPRPRTRNAAFAALEQGLLDRLMTIPAAARAA